MAEENSSYPLIQKGQNVLVLVENIVDNTLFVCLKHGPREFRGALLDSRKRKFPSALCFGGNSPNPGSGEESCKTVDAVKGALLENVSSCVSRYTYHKDVISLYERSVDVHSKSQFRPIRSSKTVRDIRLRPRQTLCVNCKCAIHDNGKGLSTRSHQNPAKHKSPSRNAATRPTRRSSVTSVQPNSHIMDSPRMSLRKRGYNLLSDAPQPKVKLTRCDSDANLVKPGKQPHGSHAMAANLARAHSNDRSRNGCKANAKQSKMNKTRKSVINAKATPVIKISIGERSVIKIPPKRSDADDVSDMQESLTSSQSGAFPDRDVFSRLEHKKLKKSNKKLREKDKDAADSDAPTRLQHRKRKRKHKHRHASQSEPEISSSPRAPALTKDPVSSSQDPEESFKENKSFRNDDNVGSTYEDESEDRDMEDTENSSPLREDLNQNRPRLLYTLSQNDGLIQIDSSKKEKKEYPLRSRSSHDALHGVAESLQVRLGSGSDTHHVQTLPTSPNVCSSQNSPYMVRSNQSSPQKSYHGSPLIRSGQDPLQVHNCQDSMSNRSNPSSPFVWSSQDSLHNQSSQDSFSMWNNSPSLDDNTQSQSHSEESSDEASSDQSSGSDSGSESDNEASDSDCENCSGPPNGNPVHSEDQHSQGGMILKFLNVPECEVAGGRKVRVGDVVWGKVQGFPWWPGKVDSITMTVQDNDCIMQNAHVLWFGSTTTSHMDCQSLLDFMDHFKDRYKKKKRGTYKKAVKEATIAAEAVLLQAAPAGQPAMFDMHPMPMLADHEDPGSSGVEKMDFDAYDLLE